MDEMLAREFVAAARQMDESLTLYQVDLAIGSKSSGDRLIQSATTGCSILSNAVYVQALMDDARIFADRQRHHRRDMRAIMGDRAHFENFLGLEKRLLIEAGFTREETEVIVRRCRDARDVARHAQFDAREFGAALTGLRVAACRALTEMRKTSLDRQRQQEQSRRLAAVRAGIFGCVVVGLDASSLIAKVGLSPAGGAVSIALGSAIVGNAVSDLLPARDGRRRAARGFWSWISSLGHTRPPRAADDEPPPQPQITDARRAP
jgi:hypothetical protein